MVPGRVSNRRITSRAKHNLGAVPKSLDFQPRDCRNLVEAGTISELSLPIGVAR
jgi:hypothetical protein